ncbi:MAG: glycosyltransferase family 2 protein [bacterium]|nr:glycosyltransferase family 2 protein [bacterium]
MFSLLIPVYNEPESIEATLKSASSVLSTLGEEYEIIVVNDGSSDNTGEILAKIQIPHCKVIRHSRNLGYGASMKTGIRHSTGEYIGTTDADSTYPIEQIKPMLAEMREKEAEMIVGARTKKGVQIPLIRRPAKAVLNTLANILVGMKIPDLNSGLRIFKRDMAERYMHLYPQGFSFTMTITLAALTNHHIVEYYPIDYFKRQGKSSMSSGFNGVKHFIHFINLIIRIVMYFRPLKFFMWPSALLIFSGLFMMYRTITMDNNISDAGLLLVMTGLQIGLFGLLADIIVRHRQSN